MTWDNHQQHTVKSIQAMRADQHFCDVTLVCENKQIETHKFLLSMCSPFFEKILKANKQRREEFVVRPDFLQNRKEYS